MPTSLLDRFRTRGVAEHALEVIGMHVDDHRHVAQTLPQGEVAHGRHSHPTARCLFLFCNGKCRTSRTTLTLVAATGASADLPR